MATTKRQRQISASLQEVHSLLADIDGHMVDAADVAKTLLRPGGFKEENKKEEKKVKKSDYALGKEFARYVGSGGSIVDYAGMKLAEKAGDWLTTKLPKSIQDYLENVHKDDDDEDEEVDDKNEEVDDGQEGQESTKSDDLNTSSSKIDEVINKFKAEPGPTHIDELVKVLTEYTDAFNKNKVKAEEEKKKEDKKKEVMKPFSTQFD